MTNPTPEQIEAAARAWAESGPTQAIYGNMSEHMREVTRVRMRAALVAAAGAAPQDSGMCGGCRDLGPHRNVPNCAFYEPHAPAPMDEARLGNPIIGHQPRTDCNEVAPWLRGEER